MLLKPIKSILIFIFFILAFMLYPFGYFCYAQQITGVSYNDATGECTYTIDAAISTYQQTSKTTKENCTASNIQKTVEGGNANLNPSNPPAVSNPSASGGQLKNYLGVTSIQQLVDNIITAIMPLALAIAGLAIVWAGFKFLTAQGDETKIKAARETLTWTLVAIAVIIGAKVLVTALGTVIGVKQQAPTTQIK